MQIWFKYLFFFTGCLHRTYFFLIHGSVFSINKNICICAETFDTQNIALSLYQTSLSTCLFDKGFLERVFIFLFFVANSEIEVSVSARNVRRLLSFQRYLRSSRFFRGITVPNSSNILDDDYNGQAKVGCFIFFKYVFLKAC